MVTPARDRGRSDEVDVGQQDGRRHATAAREGRWWEGRRLTRRRASWGCRARSLARRRHCGGVRAAERPVAEIPSSSTCLAKVYILIVALVAGRGELAGNPLVTRGTQIFIHHSCFSIILHYRRRKRAMWLVDPTCYLRPSIRPLCSVKGQGSNERHKQTRSSIAKRAPKEAR